MEQFNKVGETMNILYISDHHFGHRNIIKYENRPFTSVNEMNEKMIALWNMFVSPEDIVIHGGDFALCNKAVAIEIANSLNGYKVLVRGNHDRSTKSMTDIGFHVVPFWFYDGILVVHNPHKHLDLLQSKEVRYYLYGHIHSKTLDIKIPNAINISCEVLGYVPMTIEQLIHKFIKKGEI